MTEKPKNIGLFITCLADLFRPTVGFAAVKLLEDAGCRVHVPVQTCCGQPAYNAGARANAQAIARGVIAAFERFDYVVAPSGSCAGMISQHYPELFQDDPSWSKRSRALAIKTFELISFLSDVMGVRDLDARYDRKVTYHDSCSGLRELNIKRQPRQLLGKVDGLELVELPSAEECCGFGGTFCVKYADISIDIVERKRKDIVATGADTLLAGDLGCLMNMAGRLHREGNDVEVRHIAEVLAGMTDETPPIGAADTALARKA